MDSWQSNVVPNTMHRQWATKKWKMHIQANIDKLPLDKVVFLSRSLGSVVASCVASEDMSALRLIWFAHVTCMNWTRRLLNFLQNSITESGLKCKK